MIKINCKKIKKGFTLAEMMVVLLIMSIVAAAMTPLITRKHRQLPNNTTHGRWECYYSGGQLYQKTTTSSGSSTTTAVSSSCQFTPSKKAEYFIIQAVSGGGGGAGTVATIPAYGVTNGARNTETSTTATADIATLDTTTDKYTVTNPFSSVFKVSDAEYQSKVLDEFRLSFLATGGGGGASAIGSLHNDGKEPYVSPANGGNGGGCEYDDDPPVVGEIVQFNDTPGGDGGNAIGSTPSETYNGGPGLVGSSGTLKVTKAGTVVANGVASGGKGGYFAWMQMGASNVNVAATGADGVCTGSGVMNIPFSSYKTFFQATADSFGKGGNGANPYGGFLGNEGKYGCKILGSFDQCNYQYKTSTSSKKYLVYGAGGSAGAYQSVVLPSLNGAITVTVGNGGKGGIVNATSEDFAKGGTGGTTSFGNYLLVTGGAGGAVQYYTLNLSSTAPDPYTAVGLAGADSPLKDIYAVIYGAGGNGGSTTVTNNSGTTGSLQVFIRDVWTALGAGSAIDASKDTATVIPGANGESGSVVIVW